MADKKKLTPEELQRAKSARKGAKTRAANEEEAEKKKKAAARKRAKTKKDDEAEAEKKKKAAAKKRAGSTRNPSLMGGFLAALKAAAKLGAAILPVMVASNWLANRETKVDGRITTWAERIGPLFHVGISGVALALVPRFLFGKGKMAKHRPLVTAALGVLFLFNVFRYIAWFARNGMSMDVKKRISPNSKEYPKWTNLIEIQQPRAKFVKPEAGAAPAPVEGAEGYYDAAGRWHHNDALGHAPGTDYGQAGTGGEVEGVWDEVAQEFVPVAA